MACGTASSTKDLEVEFSTSIGETNNVPLDASFVFKFNQIIHPETPKNYFKLVSDGNFIEIDIIYAGPPVKTVTIVPKDPLLLNKSYTFVLETNISNVANNKFLGRKTFYFSTNASWTTAKRVTREVGNNQQNASVVMTTNNGGYTSLIYEEYNPLTRFSEIYHTSTIVGNVNSRTNAFGHIKKISRERKGNATLAKLALSIVDGHIQESIVWQQYDGIRTNVWARKYINDGEGWGLGGDSNRGPKKIDTEEASSARFPVISSNNLGHFISKWFIYNSPFARDSHDLKGATNLNSNIWAGSYFLNSAASITPSSLKLHLNNDDELFYLWHYRHNNSDSLHLHYGDGLHLHISRQVYSELSTRKTSTSIMNENGDCAVVWVEKIENRYSLYVKRYDNIDKLWHSNEEVYSSSYPIYNPQITLNKKGNIFISWIVKANPYSKIFSRERSWSRFREEGFITEINKQRTIKGLKMLGDNHDTILLTWSEKSTTSPIRDRIFVQRLYPFDENNLFVEKVQLSNDADGNALNPKLAMNEDGYAIVVWEQFDVNTSKSSLYYSAFQ